MILSTRDFDCIATLLLIFYKMIGLIYAKQGIIPSLGILLTHCIS